MLSDETKGYIFAFLTSLLLASEIVAVDFIFRTQPSTPFYMVAFWSFLGTVILGCMVFLRSKKSIQKVKESASIHKSLLIKDSLISIVAVTCFYLGILFIGSGSTTIFGRSGIIFSTLLAFFFLKEKVTLRQILLMALIIIGFVIYQGMITITSLLGIGIILLATFSYSLISYYIRKEHNDKHPFQYTFLRYCFILVGLFCILLISSLFTNTISFEFVGWFNFAMLAVVTFISGVVSRGTEMMALSKLELHKFIIIKNSDIIFVLLLGAIFLQETYSKLQLLGVSIVLIAVSLYAIHRKGKLKKEHVKKPLPRFHFHLR